jgi:hypothetical protein
MSTHAEARAASISVSPEEVFVDLATFAKSLGFQPRHLTQLRHDHAATFPLHIRRGPRIYVRLGPLKAWLAAIDQQSTAEAQ